MRIEILGIEEAHVVGRHHGHLQLPRPVDRMGDIVFLVRAAGALQFEKKSPAEYFAPLLQEIGGQFAVVYFQCLADVA